MNNSNEINNEETNNNNNATSSSSLADNNGDKVSFVESTASNEKGDASPFPASSGIVAPANTPVGPMFGKGKTESTSKPSSQRAQHEISEDAGEGAKKSKIAEEGMEEDVAAAKEDAAEKEGEDDEEDADDDIEDEEEDGSINKKAKELLEPVKQEIEDLLEKYEKERRELEEKFQEKFKPAYAQRAAIANDPNTPIKGFWLQAITSIKPIGVYIMGMDEEPLESLTDIRVNLLENGYQVEFEFAENSYFDNKILTKVVQASNLFGPGAPVFTNLLGTNINWKSEDKNLCAKKEREGDYEFDSFFHYFDTATSIIPIANGEVKPLSEEQELAIKRDEEISEAIRTRVIPNAIKWYDGELVEKDDDDEEGNNDEDEGNEDEAEE